MTEHQISELLKARRRALGLTVDDLAEQTGIPKPHLLALESQQFRLLPQDRLPEFLARCSAVLDLEGLTYQPQSASPSSRVAYYRQSEKGHKSSRSYLPIFYLTLLAVAILCFVAYVVHHHADNLEEERAKYALRLSGLGSSVLHSSSTTEETAPSSEEPPQQPTLLVTGGGEQLAVTLNQPSPSPVIVAALDASQSDKSWFGVTGSDLAAGGIELNAAYPMQTVTLLPDTTTAILTLGVTKGISLTIDGEVLDLSALTTDGLSTITLTIQR